MLGTTLPTDGTGLVISGDIEGMPANWESRVTPLLDCCSPAEHESRDISKKNITLDNHKMTNTIANC